MDIKEIIKQAGGVAAVARAVGVKHPSVCGWTRIPAEHVGAVAAISGLAPEIIRPDLARVFAPAASSSEAAA